AGRTRLARQLLIESLLLAGLGAVAGLALAKLSLPPLRAWLLSMTTTKIPGVESVGLDPVTLAFTFGVSALTGVLFGVLPALQVSQIDLNQTLKEGGKAAVAAGRRNLSRMLVVAEVALAVIMLIGAGLLVRSFQRLSRVDPGFRADHLLSLKINLPEARYADNAQLNNFYQRLLPRLRSLPGVEQVAVIDWLSFTPAFNPIEVFTVNGQFPEPGRDPIMQMRSVDQGFFDLMRIPLRRGRFFNEAEINDNPRNHILINETMARRFFPQEDPIGKRVFSRGPRVETLAFPIIGVVADIKDLGPDTPVEPEIYFSGRGRNAVLLLRATVEPLSLTASVRQTVLSIDPALPMQPARSVEEMLSASMARRRLTSSLLSAFALLALLLAAVGVYGVVAYSVTQRAQEIGIRMALGAQAADVLKLVIGRGIAPVLLGLALGLAGAIALSRSLTHLTAGLLFEVHSTDPVTFAAIALLLVFVSLLACYIPARRGTKIDPLTALKHE
ncbi:MAG TPA: FtsX-like permease family protein, partial [Blastocatellia bacterium]